MAAGAWESLGPSMAGRAPLLRRLRFRPLVGLLLPFGPAWSKPDLREGSSLRTRMTGSLLLGCVDGVARELVWVRVTGLPRLWYITTRRPAV